MTQQSTRETADHVFTLPDLGEGLMSGEIIDWLVGVGDEVAVDQVVVVVETEKTTTELPVPFAGTVTALHGELGGRVAVGAPLLTVHGAVADDAPMTAITHLVGQQRPAPADEHANEAALGLAAVRKPPTRSERDRVAASPAVRRLARELNVDLATLAGTGAGGAITKEDVRAASTRETGTGEG
jgi:pyruvate dehydrogenase E2 component (dihydrolipoamide acetyltransferase)